jgi:hypothetical protein
MSIKDHLSLQRPDDVALMKTLCVKSSLLKFAKFISFQSGTEFHNTFTDLEMRSCANELTTTIYSLLTEILGLTYEFGVRNINGREVQSFRFYQRVTEPFGWYTEAEVGFVDHEIGEASPEDVVVTAFFESWLQWLSSQYRGDYYIDDHFFRYDWASCLPEQLVEGKPGVPILNGREFVLEELIDLDGR